MKCPRCGADNAERAERCYLCEYPFAASGAMGELPVPEEHVQSQYPPPGPQAGMTPPGSQAVPPPPVVGTGYQPPPGAYPGGYQPLPPAPKGPVGVKVIIAVLVVLLVVIVMVAAFFLLRGKTYAINVPPPPGYKEASQDMLDEFRETMQEGSEDIQVDGLFVDNSQSNFVIVASMDIPLSLSSDTPSGDDPEELEEWFYANEDEWRDAFSGGLVSGMGGMGTSVGSDTYEVGRLATGDAVLHMATTISMMDTPFVIETLWMIKGGSTFFIAIMGLNPGSSTVESLKESITFEE